MTPDEVAAVSRISPAWAPYIVLSVPMIGFVAYYLPSVIRWPWMRRQWLRRFGWDPGLSPEDETTRRTMELVDQLQEEIASCRRMLSEYGVDIDALRVARLTLLQQLGELRNAAIAARTQLHALERKFGLIETVFDPLPLAPEASPLAAGAIPSSGAPS